MLFVAVLTCSVVAIAEAAAPRGDITLRDAVTRIVERHPAFESARFAIEAAQAEARAAGLAMPWIVEFEVENLAGSGSANGIDRLESTLSIGRVLELGNKAKLRGALGLDRASRREDELALERFDLIANTARRFLDVVEAQAELELDEQSYELAKATASSINQQFDTARASSAEQARAEMILETARIKHREAGHHLDNTRFQLAAMWFGRPDEFARAHAELFELPLPPSFETVRERLDEIPDLVRFASAERVAASRLALATAGSRPDITVSAGLRYLHDQRDVGLMFNLAVPLGAAERSEPAITAARAAHRRVSLEREQSHQALAAMLYDAFSAMEEAVHTVRAMEERVVPAAERALTGYREGYETGRYLLLELLDAEKAMLDAQRDIIMQAMRYHRHRIELERLTGGELFKGKRP